MVEDLSANFLPYKNFITTDKCLVLLEKDKVNKNSKIPWSNYPAVLM